MIIAFVVDTSYRMLEKISTNQITRLDCAKEAMIHLVNSRKDVEYILLIMNEHSSSSTFQEDKRDFVLVSLYRFRFELTFFSYDLIKASWKDSHEKFLMELRDIQAGSHKFDLGIIYRVLFDTLHLRKLSKNLDTYGYGRWLSNIEPTFIMTFTCMGPLMTLQGSFSEKVREKKIFFCF
jgi:hypothetical protein